MRKLFYLGFCLVLTMGVGCALTNYELIVDNDQVANGQGSGIVNTNGKAHLKESFLQVAALYSDGSDELIWFVDQKANGDRALTTYNNFSTGADPIFHSDQYCNPDWVGCSLVDANDPEVGDVSIFDWQKLGPNCSGWRSIVYVLSNTRYYGECGRTVRPLADRLAMLNMGAPTSFQGVEALRWSLTPMNTSIFVDNLAGTKVNIPLTGVINVTATGLTGRPVVDLTSPSLRGSWDAMANYFENYGSGTNQVEIVYNGLTFTKEFGTLPDVSKKIRNRINTRY